MARCKSCGAEIIWIKTTSGKAMPCNAKEVVYWENKDGKANIVRPNGEVVRADLDGEEGKESGIGYISHFATCPNANVHRRQCEARGNVQRRQR